MNDTVECPVCGKMIEADSQYCRYCGAKTIDKSRISSQEELLIAQSANIKKNSKQATDACLKYFTEYPDGPAIKDLQLTVSLMFPLMSTMKLIEGKLPETGSQNSYVSHAKRSQSLFSEEFSVLKNGIVIELKIQNEEKRKTLLKSLADWQKLCNARLDELFKEAEAEKERLLVDGKTRAVIEEKTMEEVYRDADIYYKLYTEKNYGDALRGFEYLKELNPMDAYFRLIIANCYSLLGRTQDALREFLYGYYLDPGEPRWAHGLIRELTARGMDVAAYALYCHFNEFSKKEILEEARQDARSVEIFGKTAKLCTQGFVSVMSDITERDYSPHAKDVMEQFTYEETPWLIRPPESLSRNHGVLDDKRIFISYRRADAEEMAHRITAKLKVDYPSVTVFLDKTSMTGGIKFTKQIREEIENADIFLVLISPYWGSKEGLARINETSDVLRCELLRAIHEEITIVPILINGARMPDKAVLSTGELKRFTELHAVRIDDSSFNDDIGFLKANLTSVLRRVELEKRQIEEKLEALAVSEPDVADQLGEKIAEKAIKYVPAKSEHGEGIPLSKFNPYGTWECSARLPDGATDFVTFDIVNYVPVYSGSLKTVDAYGNVIYEQTLSGNWSLVLDWRDSDKNVFLGFQLSYVRQDNAPATLNIPFHSKIGNSYVGEDHYGVRYSCKNVSVPA